MITHPDGSEDSALESAQVLKFKWTWDEKGYHGDDVSELTRFDLIDSQDAESILTSMEELRNKIQETVISDIDENSAQALLALYNKLAVAHEHVKKATGSGAPEMPQITGVHATIEAVREAVLAARGAKVQ